jgi:hypothetical protein
MKAANTTRKAAAHECSGLIVRYLGVLLQRFGYVAGADATGTGLNGQDAAVLYGSDLLKVRIPYGTGLVVGVAHIVSEAGPFSTNITFS